MYTTVLVAEGDVQELSDQLCQEERRELALTSSFRPRQEVIQRCVDRAAEAWTMRRDGEMLGITGVESDSVLSDKASPWLLTTDRMSNYPVFLVRKTRFMLKRWHERWDLLFNFVDAEYEASLKWAAATGFTVKPAIPYGFLRTPFHPIESRRK